MHRRLILDLGLFQPLCGSISDSYAILEDMLEILAFKNQKILACDHSIPLLYQSGARYMHDPEGVEYLQDIYSVLSHGGADCEDLSAWRVAELRRAGEPARFDVSTRPMSGDGLLIHIRVKRMKPRRASARVRELDKRTGEWFMRESRWELAGIEDPAKILGMGSPFVVTQQLF